MRVSSNFSIGSDDYQVNMWHPDKAMKNLAWLIKMVGEPIVALLVSVDSVKDLMDMDLDAQVLTPAIRGLVAQINEDEIVLKIKSFTEHIQCNGKNVKYDSHFIGRPGRLIKVVAFVLKAQYEDFFEELPVEITKATTAGSDISPSA